MNLDQFFSTLTDEQKKALAESLLKSVDNKETNSTTPTKSVGEDFIVRKPENPQHRRKEAVKARRNDWVDTGEFRDITTPDFERTPRKREAPPKQDVECHVCGKTFKLDKRFSYGEYHRCNKCAGKK